MPVSSPSYFPPAGSGGQIVGTTAGSGATGVRTFLAGANSAKFTQLSDLIVIGDNALTAGTSAVPISDTHLAGSVVIGSGAAAALTQTSATAQYQGPNVIIGINAYKGPTDLAGSVLVGANVCNNFVGYAGDHGFSVTAIGHGALSNLNSLTNPDALPQQIVVIGDGACSGSGGVIGGAVQFKNTFGNVVIGSQAMANLTGTTGAGGQVGHNVVIGYRAGYLMGSVNATGSSNNVIVGDQAESGDASPQGNVYLGVQANSGGNSNSPLSNVCIGSKQLGGANTISGLSYNVVIGASAQNAAANQRCVIIGAGAGPFGGGFAALNDQFLLETYDGSTVRNLLYGLLGAVSPGGLIVGFSTQGTNRDIPGFNILKVLNGSVTGVAPVGGGFFYSLAGRLHWVDTGNVDWVLTGTAAGQLGASLTGYTNNAAAAAATITNAPVAGNPTKWIPINDNGTIRNIPAW